MPDPYKIGRHEPDLIGEKEGVIAICEGKTGEDLDEKAKEQFQDFSREGGPFYIGVAKSCLADLFIVLTNLSSNSKLGDAEIIDEIIDDDLLQED